MRVIDGAAHPEWPTLAFRREGRGSNQLQDAGWGGPTLPQTWYPLWRCTRENRTTTTSHGTLALQLGAWRPPPLLPGNRSSGH